jgi:hypothetical protein
MNKSSTSPSTVKLVLKARGCRGHDRMVVGFTTKSTYFKFLLIAATCSAVHPNLLIKHKNICLFNYKMYDYMFSVV